MRNLLALIGLAIVGFAAIGWYCGWYKFSVSKRSDGNAEIKTTVHTDKVVEDSSTFFKKLGQVVGEKAGNDTAPTGTPGNTPGPGAKDGGFKGGWLLAPVQPTKQTGSSLGSR